MSLRQSDASRGAGDLWAELEAQREALRKQRAIQLQLAAEWVGQCHKEHALSSEYFGFGVDAQQRPDRTWKWKPVYANSRKDPRPRKGLQIKPTGEFGSNLPYTLTRDRRAQHVGGHIELMDQGGQRPYFLEQAAHKPRRIWERAEWIQEAFGQFGLNLYEMHPQLAGALDELAEAMVGCRKLGVTVVFDALNLDPELPDGLRSTKTGRGLLKRFGDREDVEGIVVRALMTMPRKNPRFHLVKRYLNRALGLKFREITTHIGVLDVDAERTLQAMVRSDEIARQFAREYLEPAGIEYMIERSRNGYGAYVWFFLRRTMDPKAYNRLLLDATAFLRQRWPQRDEAGVRNPAFVDKLEGTLAYYQDNRPAAGGSFDEERYYSHRSYGYDDNGRDPLDCLHKMNIGEGYEYRRRHYGQTNSLGRIWFQYTAELERWIVRRGGLITGILCNLARDSREERDRRLHEWEQLNANKAAARTDRQLAASLGLDLKAVRRRSRKLADEDLPALAEHQLQEQQLQQVQPAGEGRGRHPDWAILTGSSCDWLSRGFAAVRLAYDRFGDDADAGVEYALTLSEVHGASTGPRHREREERFARWYDDWALEYDEDLRSPDPACRSKGPWFELADQKREIQRLKGIYSPDEVRYFKRAGDRENYALLAALNLAVQKSIHNPAEEGELGAAPFIGLVGFLKDLRDQGLLGLARFSSERAFRDYITWGVKRLVQHRRPQLVVTREADHEAGRCRHFAIAEHVTVGQWLTRPMGEAVLRDDRSNVTSPEQAAPSVACADWAPAASHHAGACRRAYETGGGPFPSPSVTLSSTAFVPPLLSPSAFAGCLPGDRSRFGGVVPEKGGMIPN